MIHGKDIVVVGLQPWDIEIGSNCKNIAIEFARHNRVLYVNPPVDRLTNIRDKHSPKIQKRHRIKRGQEPALIKVGDNIWNYYPTRLAESVNGLPDGALFDFFNRVNGKRFAAGIKKQIEELGFKDFFLFNDNSIYLGFYLKKFLNPAFSIYYIRDFLIKNPYWKKHAVRIEPKLISSSDLVVTNSELYASYAVQFNQHSYMVGQGCEIEAFDDQDNRIERAPELAEISGPIIGYTGFLSSRRLDISLLLHLADVRPSYNIVLVGPEDDQFKKSALHGKPNVFFLGHKDVEKMPGFIKGFNVAINPQLINDATSGNYPRKVDEYLAMGKAVVARATPAMNYFADVTYLATTADEYVQMIDQALTEDSAELSEKRKVVARSHSWQANVERIYFYTEQIFSTKQ